MWLVAVLGCATPPEDTAPPLDPAAFDDDCGEVLPLDALSPWRWAFTEEDASGQVDASVSTERVDVDGVPAFEVLYTWSLLSEEGDVLDPPAALWRHRFRCNAGDIWLLESRACAPQLTWAVTRRYDPPYLTWSEAGFRAEEGWSITSAETAYATTPDATCLGAVGEVQATLSYDQRLTVGWYESLRVDGDAHVGRVLEEGGEQVAVVEEGLPPLIVSGFPVYGETALWVLRAF